MNRDQFEGNWQELKGKMRQKWGKLTDDDLIQIDGMYDMAIAKLQKRYGHARDQAEREMDNWTHEENWSGHDATRHPSFGGREEGRYFGDRNEGPMHQSHDSSKQGQGHSRGESSAKSKKAGSKKTPGVKQKRKSSPNKDRDMGDDWGHRRKAG